MDMNKLAKTAPVKSSFDWLYIVIVTLGVVLAIGVSWFVGEVGPVILFSIPLGLIFVGALVQPDLGLFGIVFITATQLSDVLIEFYHLPSIAKPLTGVLMLIILVRFLIYGEHPLSWGRAAPILILYFVSLFFSILHAFDFAVASKAFFAVLKDALGGVIVILLIRQSNSLRRAVWAMVLAGVLMGTISVFQYQTKTFDNPYWGFGDTTYQSSGEIERNRITGPYSNPNAYAQVLVVFVALSLDRVWHEKKVLLRIVAAWALVVCILTIFFTYSRGGFLTLLVTVGIMVFQYRQKLFQIILAVSIGLALLQYMPVDYIERINTLLEFAPSQGGQVYDSSFRGRMSENTAAWRMFMNNPIFGVGLGNYQIQYQDYSRQIGLDNRRTTRTPASFYAEILSEQGLVGAVIFIAFIYGVFRSLIIARIQFIRLGQLDQSNITMALFAGLLGYLFAATVKNSAYANVFWVLIGLVFGAVQLAYVSLHSEGEGIDSRLNL